jgi:hypothetical protein
VAREHALLQTRLLTGAPFKPLHSVRVDKVTRADVAARVLATERASGAATALLARSALSSCIAWALGQGLTETNAVIGSTVPERGKPRERALDDRETGRS